MPFVIHSVDRNGQPRSSAPCEYNLLKPPNQMVLVQPSDRLTRQNSLRRNWSEEPRSVGYRHSKRVSFNFQGNLRKISTQFSILISVNQYRRKRPKVDASIFDSALSHTRRSDTSEKRGKYSRPLLVKSACGQVSSPRLYRLIPK